MSGILWLFGSILHVVVVDLYIRYASIRVFGSGSSAEVSKRRLRAGVTWGFNFWYLMTI